MSEALSELTTEEAACVDQIVRAFAGVQRGDGISWREAEEIDNYESDEVRARARALDTDQYWSEVNPQLFDQLPSAVSYLDQEGLRYYLPAFMTADVRRKGAWQSAVDDGFLALLEDPGRLPMLTMEQIDSVCSWLRIVRRRHPWFDPAARLIWEGIAFGGYLAVAPTHRMPDQRQAK
jgi:hypothetical protein